MRPRCPRCNTKLLYTQVDYRGSFPCPSCNQLLYIPHAYTVAPPLALLLVSPAGVYFFVLSGYFLGLGAILACVPALSLAAFVGRTLVPPIIRVDKGITSNFTTLNL